MCQPHLVALLAIPSLGRGLPWRGSFTMIAVAAGHAGTGCPLPPHTAGAGRYLISQGGPDSHQGTPCGEAGEGTAPSLSRTIPRVGTTSPHDAKTAGGPKPDTCLTWSKAQQVGPFIRDCSRQRAPRIPRLQQATVLPWLLPAARGRRQPFHDLGNHIADRSEPFVTHSRIQILSRADQSRQARSAATANDNRCRPLIHERRRDRWTRSDLGRDIRCLQ